MDSILMGDLERAKTVMQERMQAAKDEMRPIKEKFVLIKAELIRMKDKNAANEASEFLKKGVG